MTIVLDPTNETRPAAWERNRRPESIEGLTLGLLDISKARGDVFLDELQRNLEARGATVRRYAKPTFANSAHVPRSSSS